MMNMPSNVGYIFFMLLVLGVAVLLLVMFNSDIREALMRVFGFTKAFG